MGWLHAITPKPHSTWRMKFGVVFVVLAATTALTWARYYTNSDPAATQALVPLPREHRVGTKATLNVAAKSLANRGTSFGDVLLIAAVNGTIVSVDINSGEVLVRLLPHSREFR